MSGDPQVFISYRRDDAAGYARAVYDELARRFGAGGVFIDVDDIAAGQPFDEVIRRAVGASSVLLVLIGRRWLGQREGAPARIDEPGDFVRQEVAAGLARGLHVIPVLVDGATMPGEAELPKSLRALARRNALELDNARFAADMERLVGAIGHLPEGAGAGPAAGTRRPSRRRSLAAVAVAAVVAVAAWQMRGPQRPPVDGAWHAVVVYDWANARHAERFEFSGTGSELRGSASFLGVPRGVLEGSVGAEGLRFVTRTDEMDGRATVHRYVGRLAGDEIRFTLQTEGGASPHVPVDFVARRPAPRAASTP